MATKKISFITKYGEKPTNENIPFPNKRYTSPTGEKYQIEHTAHMGIDGRRKLLADNKIPIYEMIQSHREQCEIERIVKRALNGDPNALNAMEGQYLDITGAPVTLAQAQQIIINAKRDFDLLDTETKKKFDNNVEIFIAEAGSKEWCDKLGISDRIEREKVEKTRQAELDKNYEQAMANLAKGMKLESEVEA